MRPSVSYLLRCSIALALSLGIFLFSLPIYVDIPSIAILVLLAMLAPLANLAILSLSLLVSLSGAALVISARFSPEQQHYREHEKYMRGERYARNVSDVIDMPHGDLLAIEPALGLVLAEPRRVSFQTDSAGYRNQEDYSDEKYVLNGDSFVVGNGLDQAETIGEVLRRDFGVHAYSIAFPSGPSQYDDRAWAFLQQHGSGDFVFATFVYEGNDFEALELKGLHRSSPLIAHRIADILDWYDGYKAWVFHGLPYVPKFSRTAFALGRQCERLFFVRRQSIVDVYRIGKQAMGFLRLDGLIAGAPRVSVKFDKEPHAEVWRRTKCVFFVPTKLRVYAAYLPDSVRQELQGEPPGLKALRDFMKGKPAEVVDLTPFLKGAADDGLQRGQYVFWRDDSHWNVNGVNAVSAEVARCLTKEE